MIPDMIAQTVATKGENLAKRDRKAEAATRTSRAVRLSGGSGETPKWSVVSVLTAEPRDASASSRGWKPRGLRLSSDLTASSTQCVVGCGVQAPGFPYQDLRCGEQGAYCEECQERMATCCRSAPHLRPCWEEDCPEEFGS